MADSVGAAGAITNPGANTTILTLGDLPDGTYRVQVLSFQRGTVTLANFANMQLRKGAVTLATLPSADTGMPLEFIVEMTGTDILLVRSGAAAEAAGAIYVAQVVADRLSGL